MLTEQCVIIEAPSVDTGPIRFVTTDDGRAVFAVTEHDNGILEIMASPMTLLQQNDSVPHSFIKAVDGNIILHPAIFQINVENIIGNGIHQTALLPVQTLGDPPIVLEQAETLQEKECNAECESYVTDAVSSDTEVTSKEKEQKYQEDVVDTIHVDKHAHKRNPGRPRKTGANIRALHNMKCDICGQEFNKQVQFRRHMDQHAEEKPHRCPKCPASFNIPINFTLHMATHNAGEPKCPECGRKFARMASLKSHMLIHEKEENLFCTECEDAFSTRAQLDAHLKLHGEKWTSEDVRKCKLCNRQFVQPALYRLHIREHYRLQTKIVKQTKRGTKHKTMYKCTICLKSFQKPSQLMRHIRVHTGEKPFKCSTCNRGFTQKGSLQIHMWQHNGIRPHTCNLCNAKFSQKGNLNAHILRVHNAPEGEPIYGCTHCSCVFKKLGSLNGHMKRTHSNPVEESSVPAKCDSSTEADIRATVNNVISQLVSLESTTNDLADSTNSGTVPTKKSDILQEALKNSGLPSKHKTTDNDHTKKETDARTAYVTLLDRAPDGSMRKYLAIKQRCIGNVRWYSCSFCHKEFKKPSDLIRHLRVHTQEKPFKCSRCFRSFALKSTMIAHERTHTGTKKYACDSCDKTFTCHSGLTVHARLHATPYKCNVCDKSFSASAILKNHMKNHLKEKPKLSPEAEILVPQIVLQEPLVISDADNKISLARVQTKQGQLYNNQDVARPHKCWVCPAAFRKISHLKQHYRRHTGERPYKCSKCDRRFTSNSVLKSHLHTHEDSRPYSCSVCNTKFSTQSSMKRHLVTHSNKRPFMCPYCHKTFKTSVNCRKHMKIHKHELAQRQLEQQKSHGNISSKTYEEQKEVMPTLTENLELSEDIEVSFQPQMAPDFTQAFSDQFQSITEEKEKSFLSTNNATQLVVSHSLPEVGTSNIASSQTLHADETGTITLPNYSGDQTLTPESIREIEETLNQQLFSMGVNLSLNGNLSRQIDDTNTTSLETREQPVLNIIYENNKHLESSGNTIFTSHFDSFDMSQIALQPDTDMDIGLNTTNTASMSNIFPKAIQDVQQQQLVSVPTANRIAEDQIKSDRRLMVVSSDENCTEIPSLVQVCQKYPKIIAKADTTDRTEIRSNNDDSNKQENNTESCEIDENTVNFACDLCNEVFQDLTQMEAHAKLHSMPSITCSDNAGRTVCVTQPDSLLQCHMCNERGFTTVALKQHLKTHCGTKEYQCTECPLRFCTNGGLSRHLKMHLSKNNRMQLRLQNKTPENSWNVTAMEPDSSQRDLISLDPNIQYNNTLGTKIRTDSSVSEKVLLDTVAEKEIIDRLEDVSIKKERKEYTNKCKYCPKTFRKPSDLIRHVRTHTGERPYKCDFCSKSFAVKCTLDSHMKVHTGKKTFCCHVCSSLFATKGSLKVHMRLHTGSKPFRCQICDLRFRTSGHRKVHLMKHARDHKNNPTKRKQKHLKVAAIAEVAASLEKSVQNVPQPVVINNEAEQNFGYPTVDQISLDSTSLTNPITFNSDSAILNNNSILSINEGHQFYAVTNLNFLLDNGLMTIQADDTLTVQPQNSQSSVNHDTTKVNELVTTNSLAMPSNEANSNQVVITSQLPENLTPHTPVRALPITTTEQSSIQLSNCMSLIQIGQTTGGSDKPARTAAKQGNKGGNQSKKECDICGKTFVKPCLVERHKRIHTGERPFKCDLCTKSFAQKSTLQIHQKHHTGDRPHSCPYCEFSFSQKCNLETHLKRVHQLDVVEVKKLRRGQVVSSKLLHDNLSETKILNVDDISFVELLKQ